MSIGGLVRLAVLFLMALSLFGCGDVRHQDLVDFMDKAKKQPVGEIKPLDPFPPYETYKYGAVALRSPFDKPIQAVLGEEATGKSAVQPDQNRKPEHLESFNFSALTLVGTLEKDGVTWSLIDDGAGGVHRVTTGNYLGKNHGRITAISESKVELIEIVPDGKDGWIERPRTLALKGSDE